MASKPTMSSELSNSNKLRRYVFFTDRCSDGPIYRALVDGGLAVERHDDHFNPARIVEDHEWIELCARNGWVGVSSDKRMRYNRLAKEAIVEFNARILVNVGDADHPTKGQNFVDSIERIMSYLDRTPAPFIARVYLRRRGVKTWFAG